MVMSSSGVAKQKSKPQAKPFRSVIGRTPHIKLQGDIITSPFADEQTGTTIAAGKFKATCLQLLDAAERGESITITKRGKAVARLIPPEPGTERPFVPLLGRMEGMVRIKGDIVGPHFDWWEKKRAQTGTCWIRTSGSG